MFKLYWNPRTGAFAPDVVLREVGATFEGIRVDTRAAENRGEAFRKVNPAGQLPALVLPGGEVMTESAAICLWLGDAFPDAGLLPPPSSPARARVLRWMLYAVCNIYESDLHVSYAARYTDDPDGVEAVRAAGQRRMDEGFDILDAAVGEEPFLLGEAYSVADPYILMLVSWHVDTAALLARCRNLARLCEAAARRPAVAEALIRYEMADDFKTLFSIKN